MADSRQQYPFHLAVLAPFGFASPALERFLMLATGHVLSRRIQRHQPITLQTVVGEEISNTCAAVSKVRGWGHSCFARPDTARRVFAELAAISDGVLIVHDGELPADLRWVERELCPWLRVPVRVMEVI